MLNCINGIYHPRGGEISLDGKDITGRPLWKMVELGVGRAFQHAELFPHLTVMENLLIGRHHSFRAGAIMSGLYFGRARTEEMEARRRIEDIIDFFEIYRYRDTPVGMLSYGTKTRRRGSGVGNRTKAAAARRTIHRAHSRRTRKSGAFPASHCS